MTGDESDQKPETTAIREEKARGAVITRTNGFAKFLLGLLGELAPPCAHGAGRTSRSLVNMSTSRERL